MDEYAYRWTLSPTPVIVSPTLSVVDLELSGVTLSSSSEGKLVGDQRQEISSRRTVREILAAGVSHVGGVRRCSGV